MNIGFNRFNFKNYPQLRCQLCSFDETSWFQKGVLHWLWMMANSSVAYFMIDKNRSKEAFLALVKDWEGILVSDYKGFINNGQISGSPAWHT